MMLNPGDMVAGRFQYSDCTRAKDAVQDPSKQHAEDHATSSHGCIHCGTVDIYYEPESRCAGPYYYSCQIYRHHRETCYSGFPRQLFSVCRVLNKECTRLFYSEMPLEVVYTAPGGLGPLQRLGPLAIASLRDLTIRLNLCFCKGGPECRLPEHQQMDCYSVSRIGGHDEPLGKRPESRYDRYAALNLRDLCAHLGRFLPARQLRFAFVCEVQDYDLATKLMEALLLLPHLQSCIITLSLAPDPQLRELAQGTQVRLMSPPLARSRPQQHFRLRDLPREIELEILRSSDLVAPFHIFFNLKGNQPAKGAAHCIHDEPITRFESPPIMCCCVYNAHSSSTWTCSHWHFPNSLFLVDRRMEQNARAVMYSENDWVLDHFTHLFPAERGSMPSSPRQSMPCGMQANLSRFLRSVRRVQIQVPYRIPCPTEEPRRLWAANFSSLLEQCIPAKLNLILGLSHPIHRSSDNLDDFLASEAWADQQLIIRCIAAGLRRQSLRKFAAGFERLHLEIDDYTGYPDIVDCHVGEIWDQLEMRVEDCFLEALSSSQHLKDPSAPRTPAEIHSHWKYEVDECPACDGIPMNRIPLCLYPYRPLFYHI